MSRLRSDRGISAGPYAFCKLFIPRFSDAIIPPRVARRACLWFGRLKNAFLPKSVVIFAGFRFLSAVPFLSAIHAFSAYCQARPAQACAASSSHRITSFFSCTTADSLKLSAQSVSSCLCKASCARPAFLSPPECNFRTHHSEEASILFSPCNSVASGETALDFPPISYALTAPVCLYHPCRNPNCCTSGSLDMRSHFPPLHPPPASLERSFFSRSSKSYSLCEKPLNPLFGFWDIGFS